jgi:hypothetical protein
MPYLTRRCLRVHAEPNQPGTENQRGNQYITNLGKPGGQPNRADGGGHQWRGTTNCRHHRADNTNRGEIAVAHDRELLSGLQQNGDDYVPQERTHYVHHNCASDEQYF